jgi:subtilisin family serine protease
MIPFPKDKVLKTAPGEEDPTVKEQDTALRNAKPKLTKRAQITTIEGPQKATTEEEKEISYTGKGIKVGVLDSAIDTTHRGFQGQLGNRVKVVKYYHSNCKPKMVDGQFSDCTPIIIDGKVADCTAKILNGHGTHVAGIIGAQDDHFQGVAPDVEFGSYNVFPCGKRRSARNDHILRALLEAQADGMDIINMSLGGLGWEDGPLAITASRMFEEHNVLVISAQGNEGDDGLFQANDPGLGKNVVATGACKPLDSKTNRGSFFAKMSHLANATIGRFGKKPKDVSLADAPKPVRKLSKYSASLNFTCDGMASFSSWGPSPEFGIKPEISAPVSLALFTSRIVCLKCDFKGV